MNVMFDHTATHLQEIKAACAGVEAANSQLHDLRKQADSQVTRAEQEIACLKTSLQSLAVNINGSAEAESLLCLQSLEDFKAMDQALVSSLREYWAAQVSDPRSASDEVPQVDQSLICIAHFLTKV